MAQQLNYQGIRETVKDGDVLLYRGHGWRALFVKLFTRSPYSHAGLAVWWNERLMVLEAVGTGVVAVPLSHEIKAKPGRIEFYTSQATIAPKERQKMVVYAQMKLGDQYDLKNVILLGIKILFRIRLKRGGKDEDKKLFCSEYVAKTYKCVDIDLDLSKADISTSPGDIAHSPALRFVGAILA